MLVLNFKPGEWVSIGPDVAFVVKSIQRNRCSIAIQAPPDVRILRQGRRGPPYSFLAAGLLLLVSGWCAGVASRGTDSRGDSVAAMSPGVTDTRSAAAMNAELRVYANDDDDASDDQITLREAFERYWLPVNRYLVAECTTSKYRTALNHWEAFLAKRAGSSRTRAPQDPATPITEFPVCRIDAEILNEFGRWLMADDPPRTPLRQSTTTEIAKKIHAIQRAIGPRDAKHQTSPEIVETVHTMAPAKRLAGGKREKTAKGRNLDDETLGAVYEACDVATWPDEYPALQWKTFVVLTSLIAPRAGDSSRLSPSAITLRPEIPLDGSKLENEFGWINFESDKTETLHLIPMPPVVHAHVAELMRRRGGQLYQWSHYRERPFSRQWQTIMSQAGHKDITRKDLRSTANNRWNSVREGLGDWLLGHSTKGVNERHYRDRLPDAIAAASLVQVPKQYTATLRDGASQRFMF